MSSTPEEDLVLLREAATICWESTSPAVVQAQWQAVALRVAQLTDTRVRSPDKVKQRFHELMEMAKTTEKVQSPEGEQAPAANAQQPPTNEVSGEAEKGGTREPVATQPPAPAATPSPTPTPAPVPKPAPVPTPAPANTTPSKVSSAPVASVTGAKRQRTDSSTAKKPSVSRSVTTPSPALSMFETTSRVVAMYSAQYSAAMNAKQAIKIPEYKHEIAELRMLVHSLMTVVRNVQGENQEMRVQMRGLHKSYRAMELAKIEMKGLRTEVEEARKEFASVKTYCAQLARMQQVQDMQVLAIEQLKRQHSAPQMSTNSSVEASTSIVEVERKIVGRLTEWMSAETANWNTFLAGVEQKDAKLEGELRARVEGVSSSLTADINRVRESVELCGKALEDLAKKNEEKEKADSQRQSIFFEMVEAETQKREEQIASVETRLTQCEISHTELTATEEKRWTKYETNSKEREEALLWFQEEIHRELRLLKDQVLVEMNKYEDRLGEFEGGQGDRFVRELQSLEEKIVEEIGKQSGRINVVEEDQKTLRDIFDGKITAIEDEQSETKRLWMDQYVRSTVQLHDIRSAVDKERHDRSQEFETLLQNVQGMVSKR